MLILKKFLIRDKWKVYMKSLFEEQATPPLFFKFIYWYWTHIEKKKSAYIIWKQLFFQIFYFILIFFLIFFFFYLFIFINAKTFLRN